MTDVRWRSIGHRIHVLGASGSGKTTLARELVRVLGLPHIELDLLYWRPGWTRTPDAEFAAVVASAARGDRWVIDGNYLGIIRSVVTERADTILAIDLARPIVIARIARRTLARWWRGEDLGHGNRESLWRTLTSRDSLLRWAWTTFDRRRAQFDELEERWPTKLIRLRSRRDVARFLAQLNCVAGPSC